MNGDLLPTGPSAASPARPSATRSAARPRAGSRARSTPTSAAGWPGSSSRSAGAKEVEKPFSPFHKGDGHVTDDTLMTRVLVRAYDVKRDHLDAYDVERADRARDRRREDVGPRARPRGPALPPPLPRREVARAEAPLRPRRPARGGRRATSSTAARRCTSRPVGIANAGDPDARLRRGDRPHGARTSRATGGRRRACSPRAVAEAMRPRRRRDRRRDVPASSRRTARATAIEAVAEAAGELDGWRDGGLAELRRGVRAVRLGRRALRHARAERAHPEPAARDRGAADRARPARRDRRRLRRDRARRRQLRPRLRLDRLDGRRARGRARRSRASARDWVDEVSAASRIDVEEAGRTMAGVAAEIFAQRRRGATSGARARWPRSTAGEVPA